MFEISVLIPTLNRPKWLIETIYSVMANRPESVEILVCDQSEVLNGECRNLAKNHSFLRYFKVDFVSLTKARNFLVKKANGRICVFLDDDVKVGQNYFSKIVFNFQDEKVVGLTGPVLACENQVSVHDKLNAKEIERYITNGWLLVDVSYAHSPAWMIGCNHAFRKVDIIKAGGYDENFYGIATGEDAEMSDRVKRLCNGMLLYDPTMSLIHYKAPGGGCRNFKKIIYNIVANVANTNYHFLKCKVGLWGHIKNQYVLIRKFLINKDLFLSINGFKNIALFAVGYFYSIVMIGKWVFGKKKFISND
jgi:GT2 family glycosyltransferase